MPLLNQATPQNQQQQVLPQRPQVGSENGQQSEGGRLPTPGVKTSEATQDEQDLFNRYELNAMKLLYSEKNNVVDKLKKAANRTSPVGAIAINAKSIVDIAKQKTADEGMAVDSAMTNQIFNLVVGELSSIAEQSDIFSLSPEEKKQALDWTIGSNLKSNIDAGFVDKDRMSQFIQQERGA